MSGQHGVTPAIDETEHVVVCDFLAKTNTTRAENAPLIVKGNSRAQLNILRFLDFVLKKTRFARAEIDTELLQTAFAGLIADWAIEWMIDKEKFHYAALTFLYQRRIGANGHAFGYILRTGNLRTRHPIGDRFTVGTELGLAIRA